MRSKVVRERYRYGLEDTSCITASSERFRCAEASRQECIADMTVTFVLLQMIQKDPEPGVGIITTGRVNDSITRNMDDYKKETF